jgi:hypothetical protein
MKHVARNRKAYMEQNTKDKEKDRATGKDITCLKYHPWWASNWYESNLNLLLAEKKAMSERFPGFELRKINNDLVWVGTVKLKGCNAKTYQIVIMYPSDYPNKLPKAFVIHPEIKGSRHRNPNGSLDFPLDYSNFDKITAVQTVVMVATWLYCYEYHAKHCPSGLSCSKDPCRFWPGHEAPH